MVSIEPLRSDKDIEVVELDEMHTYVVSKKNYCWIWIAVDRNGKRFLHCEVGSRDTPTGRKLWEAIEDKNIKDVMSDY